MAIVEPMYPIVGLHGTFGTGFFQTKDFGIDLVQRDSLARSEGQRQRAQESVPCQGFMKADKLYSSFPESEKQVWRDAVKRPVMSGYTLWMSECLYLWSKGLSSPLKPSISGGYSPKKAIPGGPYPPPT